MIFRADAGRFDSQPADWSTASDQALLAPRRGHVQLKTCFWEVARITLFRNSLLYG